MDALVSAQRPDGDPTVAIWRLEEKRMELWSIVAKRWPDHLRELRKCSTVDPEFREVLSDYHEARTALDRWRRIDPSSLDRIADYERLVRELETEIEKRLT